jgi:choline dehydrogenase
VTLATRSVDHVVVGAGSAGGAAAYQLARTGDSVLLIEAGGAYDNPAVDGLATWPLLLGSQVDWAYRTTPQAGTAGREHVWSRGRILGGTSAINGMVWMRGAPWDFDQWERAGCTGWGYADVTAAYQEFEDFPGGDAAFRETGGPMSIRTMDRLNPLTEAFFAACEQRGFKPAVDFNGADAEGYGPHQINARDGVRQSSYRAFIERIESEPNVTVVTNTLVTRLEFEGDRVVAVHAVRAGEPERWTVNGDVIVSAGTIESPKLLMLSGVGPADHLTELGIPVLLDLPGVGQNLHDHLAASTSYRAVADTPPPNNTGLEGALFCRSRAELDRYDLQFSFIHVPTLPPGGFVEGSGFTFFGGALPSDSRGQLTLRSSDPADHPTLDPRYLTEPADVDRLVAAVEIARDLAAAPAFDQWRGEVISPLDSIRTRAELEEYVRRTAGTFFHPVGTCRMGVGDDAVVGPDLRVRAFANLRVADASVIPDIPAANPNATATMIGWRAGGFVRDAR